MYQALFRVFIREIITQMILNRIIMFWFPEAQYGAASGVIRTRVGYTGGTKAFPTYYDLGDHTETIDLDYDPKEITYKSLLGLFWENHDSTTCTSRQYMSAIFYHNEEQKRLAEETKNEHQKKVRKTITTKVLPATTFYDAEDYHQKYMLRQHGGLLKSLELTDKNLMKSHVAAKINGYVGGYGKKKDFDKEWEKFGLSEEQAEYIVENMRF